MWSAVPRLLAVLLVVCLAACSTTRTLGHATPEKARDELRIGDQVRITSTEGEQIQMKVTAVDEEAIWGVGRSGQRYKVEYAAIASVESTRFSAGKTAGTLGAGALVLYAAAIYVVVKAIQAIGEGLDDAFSW
jgi:hypothetical protein